MMQLFKICISLDAYFKNLNVKSMQYISNASAGQNVSKSISKMKKWRPFETLKSIYLRKITTKATCPKTLNFAQTFHIPEILNLMKKLAGNLL